MWKILWSTDRNSAYLVNPQGQTVGKWFRGNPGASTFDISQYQLGRGFPQTWQGQSFTSFEVVRGPGVEPSGAYYATDGGGATPMPTGYGGVGAGGGATVPATAGAGEGYVYPEWYTELYEALTGLGLSYAEAQAAREENRRQFDEDLQYRTWATGQEIAVAREQIASTEGMQKYDWQMRLQELERQQAHDIQMLQMDWTERHKAADKELAMRLREIQGQERITAAERWARPIDYLAYNRWMLGQQAATTEEGLPVGAPVFQTGEPAKAVGAGPVPTADIYGQKLAAGGRIQEFGAWGGPTTPVDGTPWIAPHKTPLTSWSVMPGQAQQMAYARWRKRGIMPETAEQAIYAAAPTGTARGVVAYG